MKMSTFWKWSYEDKKHYGGVEWQQTPFILKAEEDGQIVGVAMGKFESGVVLINDIIVEHNKRGDGIGRLPVNAIGVFGIKQQAHKVWGYTGKGWDSVGFYKTLGYRVIGELPNHYHGTDFVVFSKEL